MKRSFLLFSFIFLLFSMSCRTQEQKKIFTPQKSGPLVFAMDEIVAAGSQNGMKMVTSGKKNADILLEINTNDPDLKPEGFHIMKNSEQIRIIGADEAGAMYGGLELAEQLRLYGWEGIKETTRNPYMELRGTKFNIPLDVRTPSYTDPCDAAQKNIPEMWNFDFWKEYIDNLARYRFNFISLWSLHPFPSMVVVPGYEEIALDDVQRSTTQWKEFYSGNGIGFDAPEILANPEIIKEIPLEQKIEFWKKVMAYGKSRNVDFIIVTWNIFVYGTQGKYGITDKIDNPITRDYFRKSIKKMFLTYPDLEGIGLTTGENMFGSTMMEKEDWAYETYGQGTLDAASEMPGRNFTFIHRQHMTGALDIAEKFKPIIEKENIEFLFSFKYAQAHVYSSTEQSFHTEFVKEIEGMKTIWTLRNDDIYYFRWGAPDFVREFIRNIPYEVSRGYYYGSDQWVWGREFLMKDPETPRQLEIVKHWYHWMMWGRLGYDPGITNDRFTRILQVRFPQAEAEKLFTAWQEASMIYPTTTGFHWGALDFQWYIEGCKSTPRIAGNETGFHDVNKFISLPPHPNSGFQSIPDFVEMIAGKESTDLKTPLEVSQKLHSHADIALKLISEMKVGENKELNVTLHDIRTIALLGKYYAHKIAGSTYVALSRETRREEYKQKAVEELTNALEYWKKYTNTALEQNINPLWTNRVGYVDWVKTTQWVEEDIKMAGADKNL